MNVFIFFSCVCVCVCICVCKSMCIHEHMNLFIPIISVVTAGKLDETSKYDRVISTWTNECIYICMSGM